MVRKNTKKEELGSSKYVFTKDMAEISGIGGGYEEACRKMVVAGLGWFDEHPKAKPSYTEFQNIFGSKLGGNKDAKALEDAILKAVGGDATGVMMQAALSTVMYIQEEGWNKYKEYMTKAKQEKGVERGR